MKCKKLLSLALAGVMSLSLAVSAFAADPELGNMETTFTGAYAQPDINVVVPQTGSVFVNPYGLAASATKSDGTTKVPLAGQVMSVPLAIKNRSETYLSIGAEVSGTIGEGSGVKFTDEAIAADDTSKSVLVKLDVVAAPATVTGTDIGADADAIAAAKKALQDKVIDASAVEDNWKDAKSVIVPSKGTASGTGLAVLGKAQFTSGEFASYKAGSIALVRLSGQCGAGSTKAPWDKDNDTFTVKVVFNFAPTAAPSYDVSRGTLTGTPTGTYNAPTGVKIMVNSAEVTQAQAGATVTVEVTMDDPTNDVLTWTVVDLDGTQITGSAYTGTVAKGTATRTFTFVMPEQPVKINLDANAGT